MYTQNPIETRKVLRGNTHYSSNRRTRHSTAVAAAILFAGISSASTTTIIQVGSHGQPAVPDIYVRHCWHFDTEATTAILTTYKQKTLSHSRHSTQKHPTTEADVIPGTSTLKLQILAGILSRRSYSYLVFSWYPTHQPHRNPKCCTAYRISTVGEPFSCFNGVSTIRARSAHRCLGARPEKRPAFSVYGWVLWTTLSRKTTQQGLCVLARSG